MVTESSEMLERLLPGSNKDENRWQGKVRVGPLDLVALRYSIAVCGGPEVFKGLAVSWFDQIAKNGRWDVCDAYEGATDNNYFSPTGEILVRCGTDQKQVEHQEELGRQLNHCRPVITSYDLKGMGEDEVVDLCSRVLEEKLRVKVRMISLGSTEEDKRCL